MWDDVIIEINLFEDLLSLWFLKEKGEMKEGNTQINAYFLICKQLKELLTHWYKSVQILRRLEDMGKSRQIKSLVKGGKGRT